MNRIVRKIKKPIIAFFIVLILTQTLLPTVSYALTTGPTQPEVQSFQPAGVTDMVDIFTGDFSYNIPLFELPGPNGGYPFNLSYQAGITMDQEASWVGLGWNLQPGAITRQMRGLPDEFDGDVVTTKNAIDKNVTIGIGSGVNVELMGGALGLGLGLSFHQNTYKGFGYGIDGSVSFSKAGQSGMTGGLSLGFSLDTQEGVGVNPSLSLDTRNGSVGLGAGYNSKQGLTSVSMNYESGMNFQRKHPKNEPDKVRIGPSGSASISLASSGYTPQISQPMDNFGISANFKLGFSWWGIYGSFYVNGFYNTQSLANQGRLIPHAAYGYLNYQNADDNSMMDFNREKDGMISKESPNLAIPSLTYDVYSVTGQGISLMYRPMRSDYGMVYDPAAASTSNAIGVGVDIGPALTHVGVNLNLNHADSKSGRWVDLNDMIERSTFQSSQLNSVYEPWYFKVHGEPVAEGTTEFDNIGGKDAVRIRLDDDNQFLPKATTTLERSYDNQSFDLPTNSTVNRDRRARNQVVTSITNAELMNGTTEVLNHYKVSYLKEDNSEANFERTNLPAHHFAGYTALTTDGLRYVYGIPAYNKFQEEVTFSAKKALSGDARFVDAGNPGGEDPAYEVANTDKFLKKTQIPAYAHSYLLTAILGPDYVDVDNNGVSEKDLGYWVKFTYKKVTNELPDESPNSKKFKWRDPFLRANFQEGWITDPRDDKGSFTYGEKELWYMVQAETKSHIAKFGISSRYDGRGVAHKLQDTKLNGTASLYKLDDIKLFARMANGQPSATPMKRAVFCYDYSLCPGVANYLNPGGATTGCYESAPPSTNGGKLTLKKVWFEYGGTAKGSLNPYKFVYHANNPGYNALAYDRWGVYKPTTGADQLSNVYFPYSEQDPLKQNEINANAAAWSITQITLPSGGVIKVDYESDDYAYVQNKTAMQMVQVVDPGTALPGGTLVNNYLLQNNSLKIRFKLEKPITVPAGQEAAEVLKYIDTETYQLYFKLRTNLRSAGENFFEYVCGYVDIDPNPATMGLERQVANQDYVYGYFTLKGEGSYHPFSKRVWQHIRSNQPELASTGNKLQYTEDSDAQVDQIKGLGGMGAHLRQMFEGFDVYCNKKEWGREIDAARSWVRLNSPDKKKMGGGLRVKQISLSDEWKEEAEGIYGQTYEYTRIENEKTISSGVAAYEPIIGGDEIALRRAKKYVETIPLRSDNNLFFEYPINESYYPGPQVGYSCVTVMSLPSTIRYQSRTGSTEYTNSPVNPQVESGTTPGTLFPKDAANAGRTPYIGTSGKVVHEFYTARDFPVITDETVKDNVPFKLSLPIPFLGSVSVVKLAATQGYSVITNDMHGKQKQVSNYRQDKDGTFEPDPISWVRYNYYTATDVTGSKTVGVPMNLMKDNGDGTISVPSEQELTTGAFNKLYYGLESEMFYDMREYDDTAWGGGALMNLDIVYVPAVIALVPIPVPSVWPSITMSKTQLRTASTNKVVFRSGLLKSMEAFDGMAIIKTENIKFDKLTGHTVLTSSTNNFNDPVYNYSVMAYHEYQGMGAAYVNTGLKFAIGGVQPYVGRANWFVFDLADGVSSELLHPGDEIILYPIDDFVNPSRKVVYVGEVEGNHVFETHLTIPSTEYRCMIARSGFRNQLTVSAGTVTALQDPSVPGTPVTYSKTFSIPR